MKIIDNIDLLRAEMVLERTPTGRALTEYAKEIVESTIKDEKNYENELTECLGCHFIASILLTSDGCPNCGVEDLKVFSGKVEKKQ
jgi:Zn finger protein HypA/HybF involved in hydrogenase expression